MFNVGNVLYKMTKMLSSPWNKVKSVSAKKSKKTSRKLNFWSLIKQTKRNLWMKWRKKRQKVDATFNHWQRISQPWAIKLVHARIKLRRKKMIVTMFWGNAKWMILQCRWSKEIWMIFCRNLIIMIKILLHLCLLWFRREWVCEYFLQSKIS